MLIIKAQNGKGYGVYCRGVMSVYDGSDGLFIALLAGIQKAGIRIPPGVVIRGWVADGGATIKPGDSAFPDVLIAAAPRLGLEVETAGEPLRVDDDPGFKDLAPNARPADGLNRINEMEVVEFLWRKGGPVAVELKEDPDQPGDLIINEVER